MTGLNINYYPLPNENKKSVLMRQAAEFAVEMPRGLPHIPHGVSRFEFGSVFHSSFLLSTILGYSGDDSVNCISTIHMNS